MLTDIEFIKGMAEAIEERGRDFVYPDEWMEEGAGSCRYTVDGEPACIVGLAIHKANPSAMPEEMDEMEAASLVLSQVGVSEEVALAADVAQNIQDSLEPWGLAYDEFIKALPEDLRNAAQAW